MTYDQLLEKVKDEAYRVAKITLDATLHTHSVTRSNYFLLQSEEKWLQMQARIGIPFGGNGFYMERAAVTPWDPEHTRLAERLGDMLNLGLRLDGQLWTFEDENDAMMFKLTWC